MTGQDEPSSRDNFFTPAIEEIWRPVFVDPVKETFRTRGSETRASPSVDPGPVIRPE